MIIHADLLANYTHRRYNSYESMSVTSKHHDIISHSDRASRHKETENDSALAGLYHLRPYEISLTPVTLIIPGTALNDVTPIQFPNAPEIIEQSPSTAIPLFIACLGGGGALTARARA